MSLTAAGRFFANTAGSRVHGRYVGRVGVVAAVRVVAVAAAVDNVARVLAPFESVIPNAPSTIRAKPFQALRSVLELSYFSAPVLTASNASATTARLFAWRFT